jgi:hypothetical protein
MTRGFEIVALFLSYGRTLLLLSDWLTTLFSIAGVESMGLGIMTILFPLAFARCWMLLGHPTTLFSRAALWIPMGKEPF